MNEWWEGLSLILKILYCIAIPSTLVLILQTLMSISGFGDGSEINISDTSGLDAGIDIDTDIDIDIDTDISIDMDNGGKSAVSDFNSLKLFTMQGLLAFFAVFSWTSVVFISIDVPSAGAIVIGVCIGFLVMYGVAMLAKFMKSLSENGTVDFRNAIGENAIVYVPIPGESVGEGKVTLNVQGRFMECNAITSAKTSLKTGTNVRVIDLRGGVLVVEKED